MFTCYFDAAGGKDHGFIVVSGWVASLSQWDAFATSWQEMLDDNHIPFFHMKKFSQSVEPYCDWKDDEPRRANLLSSAVGIIKNNVQFGAACIIDFNVFERVSKKYRMRSHFGVPYSLAGRDCIASANNHLRSEGGVLPPVEYVFDDGDVGKGELIRIVKRDFGFHPIFKPACDQIHKKTGSLMKGVIPLQAADFAAYELRKGKVSDPLYEWLPRNHRKSLQALAQINGYWGEYTETTLLNMCAQANIPLESE